MTPKKRIDGERVRVTPAEVEAARYLVRHGDTRESVRRIAEAGR